LERIEAGTLNAARPTRMPPAKKMNAMRSQITPHTVVENNFSWIGNPHKKNRPCDGKHPQILANAEASEEFTFLAIVSSTGR
jgi:hypothetical protein